MATTWNRWVCTGWMAVAAAGATVAGLAHAALPVGATAPEFSVQAALGGQPFRFSLSEALKKGPVVLYFYPRAFTSGCTLEAHLFAEATPQFKALGATVIGLSNDTLATVQRFSTEHCRNQFAVGADDGGQVIRRYDAGFMLAPDTADRISYVISPQGKVLLTYVNLSPDDHVAQTLAAVRAWKATAR